VAERDARNGRVHGARSTRVAAGAHRRRGWRWVVTVGAVALVGLVGAPAPASAALPATASDAAPVPALNWQPCADPTQQGLDCATAQVPLDYANPQGETISLALIRLKAADQAHRIGSLFANYGGPGAPGTLNLTPGAPGTPAPLRQRFDIISWDPRGVGASTAVLCWDQGSRGDNAKAEASFLASLPAGVPSTPAERRSWIEGWVHVAELCGANAGALLEHVSTTETARDLDLLRRAVGDERLSYLGVSYGTFLGAVYANLFPDRVRAMMLVGNLNAVAWTHLDREDPPLNNYLRQQADRGSADTLDAFLALCGQVSTTECAFSAGSAEATQDKWRALLQRVRSNPVAVGDEQWDYDKLVTATVESLYGVPAWPGLACQLQQAWQGGVAACPATPAAPHPPQVQSQTIAVRCAETPNPRDPAAYLALARLAHDRSGAVGPYWVWEDEICAAWPAVAADQYTGPWDRPTASPILLVNNIVDPAAPYQNAVFMAHELANARLLTLNGYGHTTGGIPSACLDEYETGYLIEGTLPPEGAVCQPDAAPFATGP
jgi:pimeloyl-ACP methyl ester carboxylesterase